MKEKLEEAVSGFGGMIEQMKNAQNIWTNHIHGMSKINHENAHEIFRAALLSQAIGTQQTLFEYNSSNYNTFNFEPIFLDAKKIYSLEKIDLGVSNFYEIFIIKNYTIILLHTYEVEVPNKSTKSKNCVTVQVLSFDENLFHELIKLFPPYVEGDHE